MDSQSGRGSTVLTFQWLWMLALIPMPWLARALLPRTERPQPALRMPLYAALIRDQWQAAPSATNRRDGLLLWLLWCALIIASARPQWQGEPIEIASSGRDLLLAVDISESMKIEDMLVDDRLVARIDIVKAVVGDFVKERKGDKLGLILFGSQAYLQTPLTFDRQTLHDLLLEARIGFAGSATAIGDAIGIAIKRFQERPGESRVLVLLSDGADTASELAPIKAAELAAAHQIRIYTIGIGADQLVQRSLFGSRRINPSADLDEGTLKTIAITTGGQYFRARDPEELKKIYAELDRLEPVPQEEETLRPTKALFYWPLALALAVFLLLVRFGALGSRRG